MARGGAAPRCLMLATLVATLSTLPAVAQDERRRSGFYVGARVGYMFGNANATLADPIGVASAGGNSPWSTLFGGVQAGYEHFFNSRLMLGLELDASFTDYIDPNQEMSYRATNTGTANEQLEYLATLRARAGYAMGPWTPFVTGGIAWASTRISRTDLTTGNEDANPSNVRMMSPCLMEQGIGRTSMTRSGPMRFSVSILVFMFLILCWD